MIRPDLDPRFGTVIDRMATAHPDALPTMHRHAAVFATGCGRSYEQALAELTGHQPAELPQEPVSDPARQTHRERPETPPTSQFPAFGAISQRVADRLRADPTLGTRQLAREIGCAANLVVRARRRLGLPSPQGVHTRKDRLP